MTILGNHPPCPFCSNTKQLTRVVKGSGLLEVWCTVCNAVAPSATGDDKAWENWDLFAVGTRQKRLFKAD